MIVERWVDPVQIQRGDVLSVGGVGLVVLDMVYESDNKEVWLQLAAKTEEVRVELARDGLEDPFCELYLELNSRVLVRREYEAKVLETA